MLCIRLVIQGFQCHVCGAGTGVPRTDDMTVMQGFGSERFAWRTRSTRRGGSRIGFLLVIVSRGRGVLRVVLLRQWHRGFSRSPSLLEVEIPSEVRAAKLGGAQRFLVTW